MSDQVRDLMSYGVQTISAGSTLSQIVSRLRRIGHEGYPVVDGDHVVGLLTRRDLDRAVEHGLGDLRVRDIMNAGAVTMRPDDPVALLTQRMVETGWGQIPVIDEQDRLIGIVTRTDLIKHWARLGAAEHVPAPQITTEQIVSVLGEAAGKLIALIGSAAQTDQIHAYLVGGVVRDLLLGRPNLDIDFVIEGDAIDFANRLKAHFGGEVISFRPFGTAKWRVRQAALGFEDGNEELPDSVDFATARNEFYEQPTALPSIYNSSIKLDLARRDFTINTLAVQISPASGRLLDFFGGVADLNARLLRVLHNLSFVDDPTRILRAVRFERRLGFRVESRTAELIGTALPMLRRITGERVRNELTLLLQEPNPAASFLLLKQRAILSAIHPDLESIDDLPARMAMAEQPFPSWLANSIDRTELRWLLLLTSLISEKISLVCERLMMGRTLTEQALAIAHLVSGTDVLGDQKSKPSRITALLEHQPEMVIYGVWLLANDVARSQIESFITHWKSVHPINDGHTLQARGLRPAPCFRLILDRLRAAWLDGEISSESEENRLLNDLIISGVCDE